MPRVTKPPRRSAGIALVRQRAEVWELLVVHPGGPYWRNKDEHGWSIPKGELDDPGTAGSGSAGSPGAEALEAAARREFAEETGSRVPADSLVPLPELKLGSGKTLAPFLAVGDLDPNSISSNTFEMEWPPRSGRTQSFAEVDRAAWVDLDTARAKLHKGQVGLVDLVIAAIETTMASRPPPRPALRTSET